MKNIVFIVAALFVLGATAACHHGHDHEAEAEEHHHDHDHGHDHGHEHHHGDNVIQFSNAQGLKVGLALEKVQPTTFGQVIRTTAQVLPSQEAKIGRASCRERV